MTSFALIIGVLPLVFATGAGAEQTGSQGTAVCFGMLGVTMLGVFHACAYVAMQRFKRGWACRLHQWKPSTYWKKLDSDAMSYSMGSNRTRYGSPRRVS